MNEKFFQVRGSIFQKLASKHIKAIWEENTVHVPDKHYKKLARGTYAFAIDLTDLLRARRNHFQPAGTRNLHWSPLESPVRVRLICIVSPYTRFAFKYSVQVFIFFLDDKKIGFSSSFKLFVFNLNFRTQKIQFLRENTMNKKLTVRMLYYFKIQ